MIYLNFIAIVEKCLAKKAVRTGILFFLVIFFISISFVLAAPGNIRFVYPTPDDGEMQVATNVEINVSIATDDLQEVIYNWNGTNYTLFNDSLVLMMNFDNRSSLGENDTHVVDVSNGGNNGTIINAVWTSSGKYDGGMSFDGDGDYVNLGDVGGVENLEGLTISFWAKSTEDANTVISDTFITKTGGGADTFNLYWSQPDYIVFDLSNSSDDTGYTSVSTTSKVTDFTNWHHVVGVYNGTDMMIYVNGVLASTPVAKTGVTQDSGQDLIIGDSATGSSFNGTIDDVMIFNRSLTADEINQLYMSNLYKYNQSQWYLYVNQTLNSTDGLANGDYTYQAFASDSTGENSTEQRTITINTAMDTAPTSSLVSPNDNAEYDLGVITFNCSATDDYNLENVTLYVWNSSNALIETNSSNLTGTSNSTTFSYNFTSYDNYTWNCLVYDNSSNLDWDTNRTLKFLPDTTNPLITIISPSGNYSSSAVNFNVSSNEALDSCLYSLDDWATNVTMAEFNSTYFYNITTVSDGSYTVRYSCNDTAGNINSSESFGFVVDSVHPVFSGYHDNSGIETGQTALFNVSVQNTNGTVLLEVNGANYTATNLTSDVYNVSVPGLAIGDYTYYWHSYGNGTLNNFNSSSSLSFSISAVCGDGVISTGEQCDDNNTNNGDGCNASCQIESGYWCMLEPSNCSALNWTAPIGIPYPDFGIGENVDMYSGQTYNFTDGRGEIEYPTSSSSGQAYTHYIDNADPSCSDSNDYGNESVPRCTIPSGLAEGSVVEIHNTIGGSTTLYITSDGSREKPVFVRGVSLNSTDVIHSIVIKGNYTIWENLKIKGSLGIRPHSGSHSEYVSFRSSESYNEGVVDSAAGVGVYGEAGNVFHNVVIYNNSIHHGGNYSQTEVENDVHGVSAGAYSYNIWVVDNEIGYMGGDSFQCGHGADYTNHHDYIGRNDMHDNGENAVDIKSSEYVVVSQNKMYNMYGYSPGSDGTIVVTHYSGSSIMSRNVTIMFNEIFNASDQGNSVSGGAKDVYIIGNVIHDIHNEEHTARALSSWSNGNNNQYIIGNTVYNVDNALDYSGAANNGKLDIKNNIFGKLYSYDDGSHIAIGDSSYKSTVNMSNNLFEETMKSNIACVDCVDGSDPQFADASNNNFTLNSTSPAIDNGTLSDVYQTFYDLYGLNISVDYNNVTRPQDGDNNGTAEWDIGAFEYVPSGVDNAPTVALDRPENNYVNDSHEYVNITFNASVTDDNGLVNCSLWHNATGTWHLNQSEDVTGTANSTSFNLNLSNVTFIWNIECYDNASQNGWGDSNRTVILNWTSVPDMTYPLFSDYNGTANNTVFSPGASYEFNATVLNTNGTAGIEFNGVNYTASNSSNVFAVTIGDLPAGIYDYYWWAYGNGTDNNFNSSEAFSYTVAQNTTSLTLSGTTPITYGTAGDYEGTGCPAQLTCNLYRDGVEVSNPDNSALAAGIYDYEYNTTGNTNYTSDSKTAALTVNQAIPHGSLTNSESWTVDYGTEATIGLSESNPGDGDVTYVVYRNGESRGTGETITLGAGTYNYILNTTGGTNYTANASMDSETLTVNQIASSISLTLNNSESNITITQGDSIDLNCSTIAGDASANLLLYRHGNLINNGTSPIGNTTTFNTVRVENITCVYHETQNYTTSSATWWVNVTQPADETSPVVTIVYPAAINYSEPVTKLNYTLDEENPDMCWFSNDSGINNYSVQIAGQNFTSLVSTEGSNAWTVYCNDTAGNINSATRYFTIDTTPPSITVIQPFNATYANNTIEFNITANEALSSVTVQLLGTNHTMTNQSGQRQYLNTTLPDGTYEATFWFNDSAGNINSTSRWFTIDQASPRFSNYLNTTFNEDSNLVVNVSVSETSTCYLEWEESTNYTVKNESGNYGFIVLSGNYSAHDNIWFSWNCEDSVGNWNSSINLTLLVTNQVPTTPSSSTLASGTTHSITPSFTFATGSDSDGADSVATWLSVDSSGYDINGDTYKDSENDNSFSISGLSYGGASKTYYARMSSDDTRVNSSYYDWTFDLTNTQPIAPSASDLEGGYTNDLTPTITFTKGTDTDTDPADSVTQHISIDSSGYTETGDQYTSSGDTDSFTSDSLSGGAGTYYVSMWADDNTGADNSHSDYYNWTFILDATQPQISVIQPFNKTYSNNTIEFNVTGNEVLSWVDVDIFGKNHSLVNQSGQWQYFNGSLEDGSYLATFWFNDSAGNINSTSRWFTIDTTPPGITVIQPFNATYANNTIEFNITANEALSWVSVDIAGKNQTLVNQSGQWQYLNTTLPDGTYEATFWVTDLAGNSNTTSRWFTIDTTPPQINVIQPFNTTYANTTISFNITGNEALSTAIVQILGTNHTMTNQSGQWQYLNDTLPGGTYEAAFWTTDLVGNSNSTVRWFTIDTTPPTITVRQPFNATYTNNTIEFNLTAIEPLSSATVQLLGTNHTMTNQSGQWQYLNGTLADGTYEAVFWATDLAGNTNKTFRRFSIDTSIPIATIFQPFNKTYGNNTIGFNLTVNEPLSSAVVQLLGTNHTMTNQSGQWQYLNDSLADGTYKATFWFTDLAGNSNSTTRWFFIDTTPPQINVIQPFNTTYANNTISFNLTANEPLSSATVQLLGTNHTMTNQSGQWQYINTTLPDGTYEATFWAMDINGNKNSNSVIFRVDMTSPHITLESPGTGYNTSQALLAFNTTVSDLTGLSNVSLWGNWSGGWHRNQTNSSGINDTKLLGKAVQTRHTLSSHNAFISR